LLRTIEKRPSVAFYFDEPRRGMLLLHFACALYPPTNVIQALLQANPAAVYHKSFSAEITPLMIACGRNASPDVIRILLRGAKNTIQMKDSTGYTAVHWACREDVSKEVLRKLLLVDPTLANSRVQAPAVDHRTNNGRYPSFSQGVTPLDILCQSRVSNAFSYNQWCKVCFILWARQYGTIANRNEQVFSTLHAALALQCPKDVVDLTVDQYGAESAGMRDKFGNFPLHYAVRLAEGSAIAKLLDFFPPAAEAPDADGQLPLFVALKHGCTWSGGIRELLMYHPSAISMTDDTELLHPFALAATSTCSKDLETIFMLLLDHPQLLSEQGLSQLTK
jgi:ankyrin repeat protein